jgi:hypothetical protein
MGTFQDRVQDYLGTIADTTALTDQLTAGVKVIADLLPLEKLEKFSTDTTDSGSGATISGGRVIGAHKSYCPAILIPKEMKAKASDSGSIHYATATSPKFYIHESKGYVLPGGGSINLFTYPTAAYNASTISGFPSEFEQAVVLYAAIQQAIGKLNTASDALNALSYSAPSAPSAPADFTLSASAPSAPADASYSYTDATLGTYTSTTIDSFGTLPTYTKPTTTFSVTTATTYIGTDEDLEKAQSEISKQGLLLDQFGKDLYNELNEFNGEVETKKITVQGLIRQAELDQQRLMMSAEKTTDLSIQNKAQTLLADIELYKSKLTKFASQIDLYQNQVNAEVQTYIQKINKFSGQIQLYSAEVQDAYIKYSNDIQRLTSEVNHFTLLITSLKKEYDDYLKARL